MTRTEPQLLSERAQSVLRDVVDFYIRSAEPVSSAEIAKRRSLSSATVRNVMADLDQGGFLRQPHTSAGRIPTADGYHVYIDSLMRRRNLSSGVRTRIGEALNGAGDAEDLASVASRLLSDLSHQVGVVLVPARGDVILRSVDFVPLSEQRVLCVVVSSGGFVDHRVIEVQEPVERHDLIRISNYITQNFQGLTLFEARTRLLERMADERALLDELMQRALRMASLGLHAGLDPALMVDGTESLLDQPELADLQRIRRLFEAFNDKAQLVSILTKCVAEEGVRVLIGDDADLTSALDFSLVATTYGVGGRPLGSLGVFGPSRMEYPRLIPLVQFLGSALSEALSGDLDGPEGGVTQND